MPMPQPDADAGDQAAPSLEAFRQAVWRLTGLIRVFLRSAGELEEEPVALPPPVTVLGRERELADGDAVEILD